VRIAGAELNYNWDEIKIMFEKIIPEKGIT